MGVQTRFQFAFRFVLSVAALLCRVGFSVAEFSETTGFVAELNNENFNYSVGLKIEPDDEVTLAVVGFYAVWCKHCDKMKLELSEVAVLFHEMSLNVTVAKIDAEKFETISSRFDIKQFPTIIFFKSGEFFTYQGPISSTSIVAYAKKLVSPPVISLSEESNSLRDFVKDHISYHSGLFVGFGLRADILLPVAKKYAANNWFAVVPNASETAMAEFDYDKLPALVAFHEHEENEVFYGPFDEGSDLEEFVRAKQFPAIVILNEATFPRVRDSGGPVVVIAADFSGEAPLSISFDQPRPHRVESMAAESVRFVRRFKPVSRRFPSFLFCFVDASVYGSFLTPFGVNSKKLPAVLVWDTALLYTKFDSADALHGSEAEFALSEFLQAVKSGEIPLIPFSRKTIFEQVKDAVYSPNFPLAVIALLVAMAVKLGRKGGNAMLPKLNLVARRRKMLEKAAEEEKRAQEKDGSEEKPDKKRD